MAVEVPNMKFGGGTNGVCPIIGLGTWKSKSGEVVASVKAAIDCGYRHIDCAYAYSNEREVGEGIRAKLQDGTVKREDLFITDKLWNTRHRPCDVKHSVQESLDLLGLKYFDLYLIHWPHAFKSGRDEFFPRDDEGNVIYDDIPYMETWKAIEECVDAGMIKYIGMSNFNSIQIEDVMQNSRIKPVVLQIEVHPYFTQEKLVTFSQDRGVAVMAYSPLASPDRPWAKPDDPLLINDPKLKEVADKYNKSPAQVVLRWLVQRNIMSIPKSVTPSRIQENIQVFDFQLSETDMAVVSGFNKNVRLIIPMVEVEGKTVPRDRNAKNYPFQPDIEF